MSLCAEGHRSCKHKADWRWETDDGCAGTFCRECLLLIGFSWNDLSRVERGDGKLPNIGREHFSLVALALKGVG